MMEKQGKKHYVLVHGSCHGAWCWFKVKPLLEKAGHRVTTLDLAASGINPTNISQLRSLRDYSQPLIDLMGSLPDDQRVILVGHSFGGLNLTIMIEMFPDKIEAAVYLTAFLPNAYHHPTYIFDEFAARQEAGYWEDTEFSTTGDPSDPLPTFLFGPMFISNKLYNLSPVEDSELFMALRRPSSFFLDDLGKQKFSKEKQESVRRVYVVCEEDRAIVKDFQLWMAENARVKEVKVLQGTDHMVMVCIPQKLCVCLLEIAHESC